MTLSSRIFNESTNLAWPLNKMLKGLQKRLPLGQRLSGFSGSSVRGVSSIAIEESYW